MDLATCLKKMELVGVLAFATVDSEGAPQIRNISAIHYESDALYFFTARGKNFCKELMEDGRVQILAYTKYKEMIRLSGKVYAVAENEQRKWMDIIFICFHQKTGNVFLVQRLCITSSGIAGKILKGVCVDFQGIFCHSTVTFGR